MKKTTFKIIRYLVEFEEKLFFTLFFYVLWILARWILSSFEVINLDFDYVTPVIFIIIFFWAINISLFKIKIDEDKHNFKIEQRNDITWYKKGSLDFSSFFFLAGLLLLLSFKTLLVFNHLGSTIVILIILAVLILFFYLLSKKNNEINSKTLLAPKSLSFYTNSLENKIKSFIFILVFFSYPFYFIYCKEIGSERIGSFFEKHHFISKYYVNVIHPGSNIYKKHLAEVEVSRDYTLYYSDEGADEITRSMSVRQIKLLNIQLENGSLYTFNNCFLQLDENFNSYNGDDFIPYSDESGVWYFEFKNEKYN